MENKAEAGLYIALSKFQSEMDFATKGTKGFGYNYADYASLVEVVRKGFAGKNLSFTHTIKVDDNGNPILTTRINYADEEHGVAFIESVTPVTPVKVVGKDGKDKTNPLQSLGSGLTYLKRYHLQALVGLPSEDDDGRSSNVNVGKAPRPSPPPPIALEVVYGEIQKAETVKAVEAVYHKHANHPDRTQIIQACKVRKDNILAKPEEALDDEIPDNLSPVEQSLELQKG